MLVGVLEVASGGAYLLNTVYAHLNTPKNGFDFALRDVQPLFADAWPTLLLSLFAI
ncbi:MAG: hypothetical protein IT306_05105, partial [Chloroflexi bacterium]|nr:hypothetical protein [Chloroflexota bacterium]